MDIAIAIPARYGSTRFPGKPLAEIAGKSMLARVVKVAQETAETFNAIDYINMSIFVTTEDERIADHAKELGIACLMTSDECKTGSDRVLAALRQMSDWPDFVINLQGDAPFTPPSALVALIQAFIDDKNLEVVTPVHQLSWESLDALREAKQTTPFSGTTAIINNDGQAVWFSKNIIPAIRTEERSHALSPIHQHIGLYGFRTDVLETFCALPQGHYEQLEGLEQLRLLENGITIQTITVEGDHLQSGIDTPEDLKRAEKFLKK